MFLTRSTSFSRLLIGHFDFLSVIPSIALIRTNLCVPLHCSGITTDQAILYTTVLCYRNFNDINMESVLPLVLMSKNCHILLTYIDAAFRTVCDH